MINNDVLKKDMNTVFWKEKKCNFASLILNVKA